MFHTDASQARTEPFGAAFPSSRCAQTPQRLKPMLYSRPLRCSAAPTTTSPPGAATQCADDIFAGAGANTRHHRLEHTLPFTPSRHLSPLAAHQCRRMGSIDAQKRNTHHAAFFPGQFHYRAAFLYSHETPRPIEPQEMPRMPAPATAGRASGLKTLPAPSRLSFQSSVPPRRASV